MKTTTLVSLVSVGLLIAACNRSENSNRYLDVAAPEPPNKEQTPAPGQTDVTKMLREASLKFRVKSVQQATATLEKMAVAHGGYVAQSMYDIQESENIIRKMTTDSAEEIKKLYQRNHMEVFVLNSKLDTFLDGLNKLVDHLEFRHITAYDINMENAQNAVADSKGQFSYSVTDQGSVTIANDATSTDDADKAYARVASPTDVKLRKKYARVSMDIYQTPIVKKWIIPNPDSFEVARGGFFDDFGASLKTGWRGMTIFFNYLISFWPLWLLATVVLVWWKRRNKGLGLTKIFKRSSSKS